MCKMVSDKYLSWNWIKSISKYDPEAQALIKYSIEMQEEPFRLCGKNKIYDWLDRLMADQEYYVLIRNLETRFMNQKFMPKFRTGTHQHSHNMLFMNQDKDKQKKRNISL